MRDIFQRRCSEEEILAAAVEKIADEEYRIGMKSMYANDEGAGCYMADGSLVSKWLRNTSK